MKEIGGYFGLDRLVSNEYHGNLISVNSGRNALLYLIEANRIEKLYIPYYLCDSVTGILERNDFPFEFYHVDESFAPVFNKELSKGEFLYIVNYFGQLKETQIAQLKKRYGSIIVDNTQAFFQRPLKGVETLYSVRKYFGVPDGAYLSSQTEWHTDLERDVSRDRMTHILGRYEGAGSEYYANFHENDEVIEREPLKWMSKLTKNILGAIDYETVRETRNNNFDYLKKRLQDLNPLHLVTPDGAFAYPFYVENGIELRKLLAKEKIYIPLLWPNVVNDMPITSVEYRYAANILPLPCDQRYDVEDMAYMLSVVLSKVSPQKIQL